MATKSNVVKLTGATTYPTTTGLVTVNGLAAKRTNKLKITNVVPLGGSQQASTTATTFSPYTDIAGNPNGIPVTPAETKVDWKAPGVTSPVNYKFNLPPHLWSVPLRPLMTGNQYLYKPTSQSQAKELTLNAVEPGANITSENSPAAFHGMRRGRMWYYLDNELTAKINEGDTNKTTKKRTSLTSSQIELEKTKLLKAKGTSDTNWGFQFLWNPTEISTSTAINMEVTPSSTDRFRAMSGVYPGQQTVNINLVLDRTNDFACIKGSKISSEAHADYYKNRYPFEKQQDFGPQLERLMSLGTVYDLEYLFKTANSNGVGGVNWVNLLGRQTADMGFLQPNLVALQLGPSKDSLSYVGWLNNISVSHQSFTESMIPLRTIVSISLQCVAGSGQASQ